MKGVSQNGKNPNFEEVFPGCLGRMVNLFELNIGVSPNKLLADKPHRDGSPVSRSRSDVSRMSPSIGQVEEKMVKNTFSNRKPNGTPMKMLIAQEMSKEFDSRRSPPNLVAKLMGLDALPQLEPEQPATKRGHHHRSHSETPMTDWDREHRFFQYGEPNECRDIYEVWEQVQPQKVALNDKRMALVRQKFVEAKRLSTDGRLRQSKQFQDALEVLSSNKDLFLKCLEEPNSVFSQQLCNLHSIPPPPDTKRITVLRPSKMVDSYSLSGDGEGKKSHLKSHSPENYKNPDSPTQPTRIVVLKPNLDKILDKCSTSPQSQSQSQSSRVIHSEDFFMDLEDSKNQESREVAKAITNRMREKFGVSHRDDDETMISSVLHNGYMADESSFNKSEIEYQASNLSDSEAASPVSRHSWDYVNRLGSPFSMSSFSRASYSPESSVCKEAKKRLSERWALLASNGSQEQKHLQRSSSTLGEMLALSESKKEKNVPKEELKDLVSEQRVDNENTDSSARKLARSKSVPVSFSHTGTRLNAENNLVPVEGKLEVPEDKKSKSVKLSFKGKVSSLFFSKNKKSSKDKSTGSEPKDEFGSGGTENLVEKEKLSEHLPSDTQQLSNEASLSSVIFKQDAISPEGQFSVSKSGNPGENPEQPSPVSVLDPPFELNERILKTYPRIQPDQYGYEMSQNPISSNLIDKSPPIGSIARTLSWNEPNTEEQLTPQDTNDEEEKEWYVFTKTLLSEAGLQSTSSLARWHSPESPLDPLLRDKYINSDSRNEAKRRQKRSMQKLVFDCVNAALVDLEGYGGLDEVWSLMNSWFSGSLREETEVVVERVVRNEVAGKGWVENKRLERGVLGNEMGGDLLEELLEEVVVELTGRW